MYSETQQFGGFIRDCYRKAVCMVKFKDFAVLNGRTEETFIVYAELFAVIKDLAVSTPGFYLDYGIKISSGHFQ